MNKKLILLMLALPLILMLCLFTATSTVSLAISVPVSKVVINDDEIVYMDLENTYEISYTVYPTNAANKKVVFSFEPYGENHAQLEIVEGKIVPQTCGQAKVTVTTVDGGYKDSFIIAVSTNKLQSIQASVPNENIKIGETVAISTVFTPLSAQYQTQLKYKIEEGEDIATVNAKGEVTGAGVGNVKVLVYCTIDESVYSIVNLTVENSLPIEFLKKNDAMTTLQTSGFVDVFVEEGVVFENLSLEVRTEGGLPIEMGAIAFDEVNKKVAYEFLDNEPCVAIIKLSYTIGTEEFFDECKIARIGKIQAEWDGSPVAVEVGKSLEIPITIMPASMEIGYEIQLSENGAYISCELQGDVLVVRANAIGESEGYGSETITLTIWLIEKPEDKVVLTRIVNTYVS